MIEVEHLSKVYGSTPAIEDLSFGVQPGEILGLLGPNGAGKTTTMRILAGYLPATSGTAHLAGYEVHTNPMAVRQRIGYLPETPPLYPDMTVEGFLHFVARLKGVSSGDRRRQVNSALERCNLQEKRQVLIRKLSKGFRQRVGIAQAIVHDPPAIILDEPTVGLDPRQIIEVRNLIKSLAGSHTVILSTHILPEVSATCSQVAIINQGRVVMTGPLENLMVQLTGGTGYDLEVSGNAAEVQQQLQGLPGVRLIEFSPPQPGQGAGSRDTQTPAADLDLGENHLKFRVVSEPEVDVGPQIAAALVGAGLGLHEMRRARASLEDVFLKLTTEENTLVEADHPANQSLSEQAEEAA